jgi:hypothetical protein
VADLSSRRIPAVGFGNYIGFSAQNASIFKGELKVDNPLLTLLSPLVLPPAGGQNAVGERSTEAGAHRANWNSADLRSKFDALMGSLEQNAKLHHPGAEKFYGNLRTSRLLMNEAASIFGNLQEEFLTRANKYSEIARKCATSTGAAGLVPDFTTVAGDAFKYVRALAVSEFLINRELSSTITVSAGANFTAGSVANSVGSGSIELPAYAYDEHSNADRQLSAIALNLNFRVLMASLNEFKKAIGTQFGNTVVVIGAEYSRSAQSNGGGSDHGSTANTVSLFSGMFQNFIPIGNIYKQSGTVGGSYEGTWGRGAPTLLAGASAPSPISNSEVASTIAELVGVSSPVSAQSLLRRSGGTWASKAEEAPKNV